MTDWKAVKRIKGAMEACGLTVDIPTVKAIYAAVVDTDVTPAPDSDMARLAAAAERIAESIGVIGNALEIDGNGEDAVKMLERIATALEAKDDPDRYNYLWAFAPEVNEYRRQGWQVYQTTDSGGLLMRRQRDYVA